MLRNVWPTLVVLTAILVTWILWHWLGDQLSLTNSQKVVYHAAILGIAICCITRTLLRLDLGNHNNPPASTGSQDPAPIQRRSFDE